MIMITREKMLKIYKKTKKNFFTYSIVSLIICICGYFIIQEADLPTYYILFIFLAYGLATSIFTKLSMPIGFGKNVKKAMNYLNNDFTSQKAINTLYECMQKTNNFCDKTRIMLLLSDIHNIRGEFTESLSVLNSIERDRVSGYSEIAISYYAQVIATYLDINDYDSVLAAYADSELFIEKSAEKNFSSYNNAIMIMINVEYAKKNYKTALDYQLIKNEFENNLNKDASSIPETPLKRFIRGSVFYSTAKLFYHCGNYRDAAIYLDIGGPLLSESSYAVSQANELSGKIRDALQHQNI